LIYPTPCTPPTISASQRQYIQQITIDEAERVEEPVAAVLWFKVGRLPVEYVHPDLLLSSLDMGGRVESTRVVVGCDGVQVDERIAVAVQAILAGAVAVELRKHKVRPLTGLQALAVDDDRKLRRSFPGVFSEVYRATKLLHIIVDVRIVIELDNVELANDFVGEGVVLGVLWVG
jgi:hypothetical protein